MFATSLNAADVVSASMLDRLSALQRSGGILQWLFSLLGIASSSSPVAHVIQPQLSQQHRALHPFMCAHQPPPQLPPFTTHFL